jgi:beta-galactosidase
MSLPYAPELGVGAPPWFTPLSQDDSLYCAMCALAYGLRGFNLYMAVDRNRWYGAPIDSRGKARPDAQPWKQLIGLLGELRFHELERKVEVGLVIPSEYRRLSRATHLLGGVLSPSAVEAVGGTPVEACSEDALGFKGPVQVLWWRMLAKVSDALTVAGIPYVYVDSEADPSRLAGLRLIITPTYEFVSPQRWTKLSDAARKGTRIVYGPASPTLDEAMNAHKFGRLRNAQQVLIDSPEDANALISKLTEELGLGYAYRAHPAPVETSVHEDGLGPRVLFVMNPSTSPVSATVELPNPTVLEDGLTQEQLEGREEVQIPLASLSCRIFKIMQEGSERPKTKSKAPRARRRTS